MIINLYRNLFSLSFRTKIYNLFLGDILYFFRNFYPLPRIKGIFIIVFSPFFPKNEYYNAWRYMGKHGYSCYPFEKTIKYKKLPVTVFYDETKGLSYVIHNQKRLYAKRDYPEFVIKSKYRALLTEQDANSSHRYVESYNELQGKTLLDIGAAEGIFALDAIEYVKKVYLFECDEEWMAPLQATFEPWKDKVEIVKKYVGGNNDDNFITIDSFMKDKEQNNVFIKMDIEGYELESLNNAKELLTNGQSIALSVCTYHNENDAKNISNFFETLGYSHYLTPGLLFYETHLRKTICRTNNTKMSK